MKISSRMAYALIGLVVVGIVAGGYFYYLESRASGTEYIGAAVVESNPEFGQGTAILKSPDGQKQAILLSGSWESGDDEAVTTATSTTVLLILKDTSGNILKKYTAGELSGSSADHGGYSGIETELPYSPSSSSNASLPVWIGNTIWLADAFLYGPQQIIAVNTDTFAVTRYSVAKLSNSAGDGNPPQYFNLNPYTLNVLFDDTPWDGDASGMQDFLASGKPIHLYVYNLITKKKTEIATATGESFNAAWISTSTIEFNNPDGAGRVRKSF